MVRKTGLKAPSKRRLPKSSIKPGVKTGDIVGIRSGSQIIPATVVEDRGDLGPGGQRLIRVSIGASTSTTTTFEVLYSSLVPADKIPTAQLRAYQSRPENR